MKRTTIIGDFIDISLTQLGATTIRKLNSVMHIVDFNLSPAIKVSYLFVISPDDKYMLQRIEPYSISHGKFADKYEIIDFITEDIASFKNAMNSHNFDMFCEITNKLTQLKRDIEKMFMHYNVEKDALHEINCALDRVSKEVREICETSERV